ncbi:MAG: type II toxin-antitoxin system VapC family toxin [Gammaproteobacteria bacterium]|nr:type II toxin-antitoxin system VapC family toxin [Gammaproteobacteria bacterium]MDE0285518.1 type II toxin-antitoxin system VapC family toxin [Gammaproteobacteria bacterium]MDE0512767.1 type II toxin-antitoxin system VapC family toxin [Gammaproteobacteria bacterium]
MTQLVIDASVSVKWLVAEEGSDAADQLLAGDDDLHAPRLMASEVANALWRKVRLGQVERGQAGVLMAAVPAMPLRWCADETVCADAVRLAVALDRPVYDCVYLALAHRIDARMVTADVRFANFLTGTEHGGTVMLLADYAKEQS